MASLRSIAALSVSAARRPAPAPAPAPALFDMAEALSSMEAVRVASPLRLADRPADAAPSPRIVDCAQLPTDWTLKLSARFSSQHPFDWSRVTDAQSECDGLRKYTACEEWSPHDAEGRGEPSRAHGGALQQAVQSWVHPQAPLPAALLAAAPGSGSKSPLADYLQSRHRDWEEAFRSLYYMLRNEACAAFYVHMQHTAVMFQASHTAGQWPSECRAIVTASTRGLRSMLDDQEVRFSMPLCNGSTLAALDDLRELKELEAANPGQTRTVDTVAAQDNSPRSLLLIEGRNNVHGFFDFLLNYRHLGGPTAGRDVPMLLSPVPFCGACLQSPELALQQFQRADGGEGGMRYCLDVRGMLLPPWVLARLCTIFQSSQSGSFDASYIRSGSLVVVPESSKGRPLLKQQG
eukprot:SM000200S05807  [mRNA]  locus=s200:25311:28191:+ [translate_table: standard]